jgi:hypothetical protein
LQQQNKKATEFFFLKKYRLRRFQTAGKSKQNLNELATVQNRRKKAETIPGGFKRTLTMLRRFVRQFKKPSLYGAADARIYNHSSTVAIGYCDSSKPPQNPYKTVANGQIFCVCYIHFVKKKIVLLKLGLMQFFF